MTDPFAPHDVSAMSASSCDAANPLTSCQPTASNSSITLVPEFRPVANSAQESDFGPSGLIMAGLLLALGAVWAVLARRKKGDGRLIRIVESVSLGPRRSLVVAQLGAETLLIGSSEAGLCLLSARANEAAKQSLASVTETISHAVKTVSAAALAGTDTILDESSSGDWLGDLRRNSSGKAMPSFLELFTDSLEDEELRQKLANGTSGKVQ